jgi:hypothetical protein
MRTTGPSAGILDEPLRAVRWCEDRLGDGPADLPPVDVERGHDPDVAGEVAADVAVHQSRDDLAVGGGGRFPVELDPLQQRAGAVPDAGQRDPDLTHGSSPHPWFFHPFHRWIPGRSGWFRRGFR